MTDELAQLDASPKTFRWWLIPALISGFIGSLATISGAAIACSIVYELTVRHDNGHLPWMVIVKGATVVIAYLTLGGCLLFAAICLWRKKLKVGLMLVATGVLVMSLAVMLVS